MCNMNCKFDCDRIINRESILEITINTAALVSEFLSYKNKCFATGFVDIEHYDTIPFHLQTLLRPYPIGKVIGFKQLWCGFVTSFCFFDTTRMVALTPQHRWDGLLMSLWAVGSWKSSRWEDAHNVLPVSMKKQAAVFFCFSE